MKKGSLLPILIIASTALLSVLLLPVINNKLKPGETNYLTYWNPAEKKFLEESRKKGIYAGEKTPVIETDNTRSLGKLTALTFLHWVSKNPQGVIALPTGQTSKFFIEYLSYFKKHWKDPEVYAELKHYGLKLKDFPETKQLKLVQLREFYPITDRQNNSFSSYIKQNYIDLLQISEENVLSMEVGKEGVLNQIGCEKVFPDGKVDLTLTERNPLTSLEKLQKKALEQVLRYCASYENKIRQWGGIGFFLTEIGSDGQLAFNMKGASHSSLTRLVKFDYPSAVAMAKPLGGIEYSKDKAAITVGLETLKFKEDATIIMVASGEDKALVISKAVQKCKNTDCPASAFQDMKGLRFYLTKSAASLLEARQLEDFQKRRWNQFSSEEIDDVVAKLSLQKKKRIIDLKKIDFMQYPKSAALMRKYKGNVRDLLNEVRNRLIAKIERGLQLPKRCSILHTGSHHNDIVLSYHPLMRKILNKNVNYFAYLSGEFNSVTNHYVMDTLQRIPEHSLASYSPEIFHQDYAFILRRYINAAAVGDKDTMGRTESIIMLKNICRIFNVKHPGDLKQAVRWLKYDYFPNRVPGEKDILEVKLLKGSMRESEADRMLLMAGVPLPRILHLRASIDTGNQFGSSRFTKEDVKPFVELFQRIRPSIITVALNPEGRGSDTQGKELQVVAKAMRGARFGSDLKIWGHRSVWHRFNLSEANLMVPILEADIKEMNEAFLSCFSTERSVSFPTVDYDGPFSGVAETIQRQQYEQLKTLLGEAFFLRHADVHIRNASGFVFIKEMSQDEFLNLENTKKTNQFTYQAARSAPTASSETNIPLMLIKKTVKG